MSKMQLKLELQRVTKNDHRTLGILYIDGQEFCYTLEDVDRGLRSDMDITTIQALKQYGRTAIPKGTYDVVVSLSKRFKTLLPEVLNVKGFTGIRIHAGNTEFDTLGCILVGTYYQNDEIKESRAVLKELMVKLKGASKITLDISEA